MPRKQTHRQVKEDERKGQIVIGAEHQSNFLKIKNRKDQQLQKAQNPNRRNGQLKRITNRRRKNPCRKQPKTKGHPIHQRASPKTKII